MGSGRVLHIFERIFNLAVAVLLLGAALFAGYSLWDNEQVYASAQGVRDSLLSLRPQEGADAGPGFEELRKINPDVVGWISLDGTRIDYPIVQGKDELEYLNKDVYGDFSLAGAIFLSTQCSGDFTDAYSLIYGHHMADSMMFGDLDLYLDGDFFDENSTGTLITPDETYGLEVFEVLTVTSSDSTIFSPTSWKADCSGAVAAVADRAVHIRKDVAEKIEGSPGEEQIVALTTCSSEGTQARTIVLAHMVSQQNE